MECILCDRDGRLEKASGHGEWDLIHCLECGAYFWHPLVFVKEQYTCNVHCMRPSPGEMLMPYHYRAFEMLMERTSGGTAPLGLLDIGCGKGSFLRHVLKHADRFGCYGLDLNPHAVEHARGTLGDRVACADILDESGVTAVKTYDVVCFFEVLEHQTDPRAFLRRAMSLLKPGGLVLGSVPNNQRYLPLGIREPFDYPPHHLTWWDKGSLSHLFEAVGLRDMEQLETSPWGPGGLSLQLETGLFGRLKKGLKQRAASGPHSAGRPGGGDTPPLFAFLNSRFLRLMRASLFMPLGMPLYFKYLLLHGASGRFLVFSAIKGK
jgi:SAM-dependent methyltransferase